MNYLWAGMILIGVIYGTVTGNIDAVSEAFLSSAKEAVTLCITMLGVMALWTGIMEIAKEAGLIRSISGRIQPLIHFLFPGLPEGHEAQTHITTNFISNFLGLGWAATPAGLKAMESLAELEEERRKTIGKDSGGMVIRGKEKPRSRSAMPRGVASNEMCTFLILNISSLQLIPVNVIAYRAQYGSVNPTAIVGPGIVATLVSTGVAVLFCKAMEGK
ncbi:MAG: nucleoside recognition protein [Lachnospiraceae bacterium]|nr:nucleoside recognition protein [Lachnospiraceae bacterium]